MYRHVHWQYIDVWSHIDITIPVDNTCIQSTPKQTMLRPLCVYIVIYNFLNIRSW